MTYGISEPPATETPITTVEEDTILTDEYGTIEVDCSGGMVTLTLEAAVLLPNKRFYIKKIDSSRNPVKVVAAQDDTIDGREYWLIEFQYDSITIESDGISEWLQE